MCIRNTYNISYAHILFIPYFSTKWCVYLIYIYTTQWEIILYFLMPLRVLAARR